MREENRERRKGTEGWAMSGVIYVDTYPYKRRMIIQQQRRLTEDVLPALVRCLLP